jgi:hypothetical protein
MQSPSVGYTDSGGGVVKCVPDPNGSGATVLQMTVSPQTCAYNCEQREDWDSPRMIGAGASEYISIPIMVPKSFPCTVGTGSPGQGVMFNEQFGAPTNGSPSNDLDVHNKSGGCTAFAFSGDFSGAPGGGGQAWLGSVPAADGKWHDFIEHVVFSTSPSVGEIQLWEDGNPITFNCPNVSAAGCGTTTLHYPTLIPGGTNGSNNWVQINNYRNFQSTSLTTTFYHGAPAMGSSYASVQSTIVGYPGGP